MSRLADVGDDALRGSADGQAGRPPRRPRGVTTAPGQRQGATGGALLPGDGPRWEAPGACNRGIRLAPPGWEGILGRGLEVGVGSGPTKSAPGRAAMPKPRLLGVNRHLAPAPSPSGWNLH